MIFFFGGGNQVAFLFLGGRGNQVATFFGGEGGGIRLGARKKDREPDFSRKVSKFRAPVWLSGAVSCHGR